MVSRILITLLFSFATFNVCQSSATEIPVLGKVVYTRDLTEQQVREYCFLIYRPTGACMMKHEQAKTFCAELGKKSGQGARLPTLREFAELSKSLGSKGYLTDSEYDLERQGRFAVNVRKVSVKNPDGTIDSFNFSHHGYQRPSGGFGEHGYWSSSVHPTNPNFAFYFSGKTGEVGRGDVDQTSPVVCAVGN